MKRFYFLFLIILGAVALFGCEQKSTLGKPTNVTLTGDVVSWDAVTGAESYIVVVNSTEHVTTATTFDLSTLNLTAGNYTITVVAKKGTTLSAPSTGITYVVQGGSVTLTAPIVNLTGNILTWQTVANATGYQIIVNGNVSTTTTQTTFDLSTLNLTPGAYTITVKATAGTVLSQASAPRSYTVISVENREIVYANLLKAVNPSYVPNMVKTDFVNEFEYNQYVRMETMVNLYLDVAISEGMDANQMVDMMGFMVGLPAKFEDPRPSLLKEEFDKLGAYGMSPQIFASFVLTLGHEALGIALEEMESNRVYYEEQLAIKQTEIATFTSSTAFVAMQAAILTHVSIQDQILFGTFLMNIENIDVSRVINASRDYMNARYWEYTPYIEYYYYGDETDQYIDLFIRVMEHAYQNNDTAFINSVMNYYPSLFDPLWDIYYKLSDVSFYKDRINEINTQVEMVEMIIDMLENESEYVRTIIEEVGTYIQTVYQAIPATLIDDIEDLLSSGQLSMEEVLILKDEITSILIETIPAETSFEIFYETLITLAGSMFGYNVNTLVGHADTIAKLQRNSTLLGLEFILSIDISTINDVQAIVDGMVTQGYYDDMDEIYYEGYTDPTKVVELVLYVLTYLDNFLTEQATLVSAIEAIDVTPMVVDFVGFAVTIAKTQLEDELDPAMFDKVSALLDELVLQIPSYIEFYEMVYAMDKALIQHLIQTEGAMLFDLVEFMETEEKNPEMVLNFIELMIDHVMDYRGLIRSDIDQDFITAWVNLMKLPVKVACIQGGIDDDCDGIFEAIKPHLIEVILNVLELEETVMAELNSLTNIYAQINLWGVDFETGLMIHVILSVDRVLDQKRALIDETIAIVIDDILGNTGLQDLLGIDAAMLIEIEANINDGIAHIDIELDRIAGYTFNNLTPTQIDEIHQFFEMFMNQEEPPMVN
jgi:hypothetical protein